MLTGNQLIQGDWKGTGDMFANMPVDGEADSFRNATADEIDQAVTAAEAAFPAYAALTREARAEFLEAIAEAMEANGAAITEVAGRESGLPPARLQGELGRTTGQLRLFATHIREGDYLDRRHDTALPDRAPLPRPELRMFQRPIGPVAVFGASNFPLAFSVAGGDTASALAAGCPVVVKGHPAHPGTCELVAEAIRSAMAAKGIDPGVFALVQGATVEVGAGLVQHPLIRAVGFTGSLGGGRALYDLCAARPEPIPFFGELGSVNPVFVLPAALAARGTEIARAWAGSLTMGAGQFCTNPGIVITEAGPEAEAFAAAAAEALAEIAPQTMLTNGICAAYETGRARIAAIPGTEPLFTSEPGERQAGPSAYRTTGAAWRAERGLGHEVFGPMGLFVTVADAEEMRAVASELEGQLTCTLQLDAGDHDLAASLLPILERKAGRILANGFPTGVEVAGAMVHGGPYPASTNFGHTSVGTLAIRRWLRPVCYQNLPEALLPADLAGQDG